MKTILIFSIFLFVFLCSISAQSDFKILYHEIGYTTASGIPLIFADKSDTSRKEIVSKCVNLIQSDSLAHIFYEISGRCGEMYNDSTTVFGKKANHHDVFFNLSSNKGYEYRNLSLKKSQLWQFDRQEAEIVITEKNIIVGSMNCNKGYINVPGGIVNLLYTNDPKYPNKSYYRGFVIPGILVEMYWSSRSIHAKMQTIQRGNFQVEVPDLKIKETKN